ncbi:DUF4149 domain-containing protein [Geomesophilobacter sediminis]|uniref:DUF4149 domain-containing protein n=1 Tax=Geomesophilobacter sediminis TaxID=2798584 RepID=A0A8J7M1R3_9BACT|nr:DUF4149 domain-containing protein [Geomesophilobacter sediminis]MBJ6727052.1 DUF4149 domain-containing protein [Geomesophilobacter sediminis]
MNILNIIYHLAVSLWVGGAALFTFVLTPILFRSESRDTAARIVGLFFPGYFRWGVVCGVVALATVFFRGEKFGLNIGILAMMLAFVSFQAFYIEPNAAILKQQIGSFEKTTKDHPLRQQFSRLHAFSATCNLAVIAGGVTLVVLF